MKKIVLIILCFVFTTNIYSQDVAEKDTTWTIGGFGSLVFNQVAFSDWAAGGENSFSLTALGFGFANYHFEKNYWNSFANLQYGFINSQYNKTIRKNNDVLELQSKAGHEIGKKFYFTGLINFRSQFGNGYNYPNDSVIVSKFLAPGYLTLSLGIEWKPVDWFSLYLSPATGKLTFIADEFIADQVVNGSSLWGTDPAIYDSSGVLITHGQQLRSELGTYLTAGILKDVTKNINIASRLALFNNYTDKNKDNRYNIDVNFDLLLTFKFNNWFSANFFTNIIYDNDIIIADVDSEGTPIGTAGPRTQIKEGFGLGLTMKIGDELK